MAIEITAPGQDTTDFAAMKNEVEQELLAFNRFFSASKRDGGLANAPLHPSELALLRTYLVARLSGRFSPQGDSPASSPSDGIDSLFER